ncbi:hypothetical protein [Bradyrhizobium zhanjiangense]|nr:hypothetical protein [Bradyrhizobium zhanjiangense]
MTIRDGGGQRPVEELSIFSGDVADTSANNDRLHAGALLDLKK